MHLDIAYQLHMHCILRIILLHIARIGLWTSGV